MKTIFKIVHQQEFDRYLFIHEVGGHIIGLNFHWDNGEDPMTEYHAPNELLTNIYSDLQSIDSEYDRINTALDIYLTTKNFFTPISVKPVETEPVDGRTILIPKSQMELVRNAINFYLQSIQNLEKEYADSRRHDIFDLNVLSALCNYSTTITLTEKQCETFGSLYGQDLPNYVY